MSLPLYYSLVSRTYKGLTTYQVLSWNPPRIICWTGEEDHVTEEYRDILEDHFLYLFEDKANSNLEFLLHIQRQSIVFICWALIIQIAQRTPFSALVHMIGL